MMSGALATAFLGKSPDGSGRAIFAGLHADGSVVQVHVEQGVDGLAPAGTVQALNDGGQVTRGGMVFNWVRIQSYGTLCRPRLRCLSYSKSSAAREAPVALFGLAAP
jgi:hypothetical protein